VSGLKAYKKHYTMQMIDFQLPPEKPTSVVCKHLQPQIFAYFSRYYRRGNGEARDRLISEAITEYFAKRGYKIDFETGKLVSEQ